ncbi:hypothetical protein BDP81DRAFT_145270 [Colletotrichum phormii]|uniref:Uncharacterized protein n=1 Tax=Colletotrichum phormii TaxID=359342 RepID=A0AAI9ZDS3_9PEZI|nr:uncharacterized protein BDP81DRAFT_145270 [Colletotrichum phormii]KAK1622658.1 hypothetical protein BDP81DRAFT_145270 [Colletotrichum phormii]
MPVCMGSELRKQRVQIWSNWQGTQPCPSLGLLGYGYIMIKVPIRQAQTTKSYSILGCSLCGLPWSLGGGFIVIESTLTRVDHGGTAARQLETRRTNRGQIRRRRKSTCMNRFCLFKDRGLVKGEDDGRQGGVGWMLATHTLLNLGSETWLHGSIFLCIHLQMRTSEHCKTTGRLPLVRSERSREAGKTPLSDVRARTRLRFFSC